MSAMKNRKELLTMNSRGLWNHSPDTANIKFGSNRSTVREFARQRRTEHGFRHALVRAKCSLIEFRAMQTTMALVLILTILTFFEKLFMADDLVYRIKHHKQQQIEQYWQIFNLISTSTLTSPEIKTNVLLGISESHESRHVLQKLE